MFDLFRSRAKSVRYLLGALLLLVALAMVVTLIPGFGSAPILTQQVLAEVGDEEITYTQFQQMLGAQIQAGQLNAATIPYMLPELLNRTLGEFAAIYEARRLGFKVTDQELADEIQLMLPQLFQNGKFVGGQAYRDFLLTNGLTVQQFEDNVRKQVLLRKVQAIAFEGVVVAPDEVEQAFRRQNEKVRLQIASFTPQAFASRVSPTAAEIQQYYDQNQAAYVTPQKRAFEILVVDEARLGEATPISEDALRQTYARQLDRFQIGERVRARHILVQNTDKPAEEARKEAESILQQLKNGGNFEALAKEHSEDPGTASQGGSLGWFGRGEMYPEFEEAAFALKVNELSSLVETQVGYHIIQVLEKEPSRVRPFEEVRDELATEAKRAQLFERMPQLADQARAELLQNPQQAKAIADKLNLVYAKADAAAPGDPLPGDLGSNPTVNQTLQEMAKDGVTPVMQLAGGRLAVAVVNDILPQGTRPLSEVRDEIRQTLSTQKGAALAQAEADKFGARLDANGRDFLRTARETGTSYKDSGLVTRNGPIDDVGSASTFGEVIFQLAVGAVHGPHRVGDRVYFLRIAERQEADMSELPGQREAILSTLRNEKMIQRRDLFEDGLVQNLRERGQLKVNEDVLNQLLTSLGAVGG